MEFLSQTKPKARKQHRCNYCSGIIEKGEKYNSDVIKNDYLYTWKAHSHCQELVSLLNIEDDWGEGITQEYFMESIWEEYAIKYDSRGKIKDVPTIAKLLHQEMTKIIKKEK